MTGDTASTSTPTDSTAAAEVIVEKRPTDSGVQPLRTKRQRQPILTLVAFYERKTTKPASFLKDLRTAERWDFDVDDVEAALGLQVDGDKDLARVTQLMAAALKERDGRFVRPVIGFGERVIRARLMDKPYFVGVDRDAMAGPEEKLVAISRALGPKLREPGRRAESANLLLATILWLHQAEGLEARAAVDTMTSALTASQPSTRDKERAKLVWLGAHQKDVRAVADLLAPSVAAASRAAAAVEAAELQAAHERSARKDSEADVVRIERDVADLQKMVMQLEAEVARLNETLTATRVHARHDVAQVKARVVGVLDSQLRDLVNTVEEALGLDPPRVAVAREKVDVIARELERQVAWLRS